MANSPVSAPRPRPSWAQPPPLLLVDAAPPPRAAPSPKAAALARLLGAVSQTSE